jgi:hypothetical protein
MACEFLPQYHVLFGIHTVQLHHVFCQINSEYCNLQTGLL